MATTWEELKTLAKGNPYIEEVGNLVLEMNTDKYEREILEGKLRFKEVMATVRYEGLHEGFQLGIEKERAETAHIIEEKNRQLSDQYEQLVERKRFLLLRS